MYLIVGLGNPGTKYAGTRHNIGFSTITYLCDKYDIKLNKKEHKAVCGTGFINGMKVMLAEPQTYMNLSGEAVRELVDFYRIDPENELIVISDDVDLEPGNIRIRPKGSAGGHNGLKNIIQHLGTQDFTRIKIGVGKRPDDWDLGDHVLARFDKETEEIIRDAIDRAGQAVVTIMEESPEAAMNKFNQKVRP